MHFSLEKEVTHDDIVLVRANTSQEVREAYKNYFTDARDFIDLIENGCEILFKVSNLDLENLFEQ